MAKLRQGQAHPFINHFFALSLAYTIDKKVQCQERKWNSGDGSLSYISGNIKFVPGSTVLQHVTVRKCL